MTRDLSHLSSELKGESRLLFLDLFLRSFGLLSTKEQPLLPKIKPGEVRASLPFSPPMQPEPMAEILADFESHIRPALVHSNSAGNLAIPLSLDFPAFVGALLALATNQSRPWWYASPAASEVEEVVLDWFRQMLGLPNPLFGMIHQNSAILESLVAASVALPDLHMRKFGLPGRREVPRLRLYSSREAHFSVEKAAIVMGIGEAGLRKIETDEAFRMKPEKLEQAIREDIRIGWLPFAVVATVGTTSTGSIDPVPQIADLCEKNGLWLHVDAAFGGLAALLPEKREVLGGCDRADSLTINPHKWLGVPVGCSILYTSKPDAFKAAFCLTPSGEVPGYEGNRLNYTYTLPHGFPALALWTQIRARGQDGLQARIRLHLDLSQRFARWLDSQPEIECMAPISLQVVCFRLHPRGSTEEELERINGQALELINARGNILLSSVRLAEKKALRVYFGAIQTDERILPILQQEILSCLTWGKEKG